MIRSAYFPSAAVRVTPTCKANPLGREHCCGIQLRERERLRLRPCGGVGQFPGGRGRSGLPGAGVMMVGKAFMVSAVAWRRAGQA